MREKALKLSLAQGKPGALGSEARAVWAGDFGLRNSQWLSPGLRKI